MLQPMGSRRVGHNLVTEKQQQLNNNSNMLLQQPKHAETTCLLNPPNVPRRKFGPILPFHRENTEALRFEARKSDLPPSRCLHYLPH